MQPAIFPMEGPIGIVQRMGPMKNSVMHILIGSLVFYFWIGITFTLLVIRIFKENTGTLKYIFPMFIYALRKSIFFAITWLICFGIIVFSFPIFIVPSIVFYIWYSFTSQVIVFENHWGFGALFRSREVMRGMWGTVFIYTTIFFMLFAGFQMLLTAPFYFWKPLLPYRLFFSMVIMPIVTTIVSVCMISFKTVFYVSLSKIHLVKKRISIWPEFFSVTLAILGFVVYIMATQFIGERIKGENPYRYVPATIESTPSSILVSPRLTPKIARIVGSAPSKQVSVNQKVAKDFYTIGTKIGIYFFEKKYVPVRLSDLGYSYFEKEVPINDETGDQFYYVRIFDSYGNPNGYRLCPTQNSPKDTCYTQEVYY